MKQKVGANPTTQGKENQNTKGEGGMTAQATTQALHEKAGWLGRASWVLFDWAAQPYYTLILTFIFAPFFAAHYMGDPVTGQAVWGYIMATSAAIVALASPILGAIADRAGTRKPWIGVFSLLLIVGAFLLWFAEPGGAVPFWLIVLGILMAALGAEFATVFTNSMLPDIAKPGQIGRLSGIGWGLGYVGGLLALAFMLIFLVADAKTGRTMAGLPPLFGLDPAAHEGARAAGPLTALWYLVFVLPLFLFTPDHPSQGKSLAQAFREGMAVIAKTLRDVRQYKNIVLFLAARMLYADGLAALFTFGGIYAKGIFNWSTTALGVFGIVLGITAMLGSLAGSILDDRIGSKRLALISLAGLVLSALGAVSVTSDTVLFVIPVTPTEPGGGLFASPAEQVYMLFAMAIGFFAGPSQAASRTLMARISPMDKMTEFFGLFAFSGKATAFAAPALLGIVTQMAGSQRAGISVIIGFLFAGMVLLLWVKEVRAT